MGEQPQQYLGSYRLLRRVGQGGFADVYLGEHPYLQTVAAIKVLHTRLTDEKGAQFCREAQIIAKLIHPHIVRVLDFGVEAGVPFLVMDYAPYGTLREAYPPGIQHPLPKLLPLVQQIASALEHAHAARVVHCDLKPENLLLGRNYELWLSDFGIAVTAHQTHSLTTQAAVGTVAYMAPEQLRGNPRPASDQYALGVMLYEWLCGRPPFEGAPMEVAMQHLSVEPPPMRVHGAAIPPEIEAVIFRALRKNPQERFPSVQAFVVALEQVSYLNPAPVLVSEEEPADPMRGPLDWNPPAAEGDPLGTQPPAAAGQGMPRLPLPDVAAEMPTPPMGVDRQSTRLLSRSPRPRFTRRRKYVLLGAALLLLALAFSSLILLATAGRPLHTLGATNRTTTISGSSPAATASPGVGHTPQPRSTPSPGATASSTAATPSSTPTAQPSPTATGSSGNVAVTPDTLSFSLTLLSCLSKSPVKTVTLQNTGDEPVTWQATVDNPDYLTVSPLNGSLDATESKQMSISLVCSKSPLSVTDHVVVTWNGTQQVTITVKISLL